MIKKINFKLFTETHVKIHLFKSIALAPLFTLAFYFIIVIFMRKTQLFVYFCERESMPYLCTFCSWIAILLLFFRWKEQNSDFKALSILEKKLTEIGKITSSNSEKILSDLTHNEEFVDGDLTYKRTVRLMRHVQSGSSWAETESLVKGMSTYDTDAVESSYNWVKFLIWLIPILGFIGTVFGIGDAIAGFNSILNSSGDFESMKSSLGGITSSLAYAFDTTLVALLQDALIMFMISVIQKQGDDLLLKLDEIFTDDLLVRIEHVEQAGGGVPLSKEGLDVLERFSESAKNLTSLAKLDSFEKTLSAIYDTLEKLSPVLSNLQKKRSLHLKLEEIEEA